LQSKELLGHLCNPPSEKKRHNGVYLGLGAHPWWVTDGSIDAEAKEQLLQLAKTERFIGEIGLDFGKKCLSSSVFETPEKAMEAQVDILRSLFEVCAENPVDHPLGRVFSIHAVKSTKVVLDLLEEYQLTKNNHPIFHWFSGTSEDLQRAIALDCCFSVNEAMLDSKRGREYVKAIPENRLLFESDLPRHYSNQDTESFQKDYLDMCERTLKKIIILRGPEAWVFLDDVGRLVFRGPEYV
jgi:TatD DNase family protein